MKAGIYHSMGGGLQVASIYAVYRYPVKSMAGEEVVRTSLTESGLYGDRLYAFESSRAPKGMLRLTSRDRREMLRFQPKLWEDGSVAVTLPGGRQIMIDSPAMLDYLGNHSPDASAFMLTRTSAPQTDVRPLSLISLQTIRQLSAEMGQELETSRFRANLCLDMPGGPFSEDKLVGRVLRIGLTATIQIRERVPRCRFVTYDPAEPRSAPLFSLMKLLDRSHNGRAGVYATIKVPGPIAAGDSVQLADECFP